MRIVEVIESRRWRNKRTGQTASPLGAVPWAQESERQAWVLETVGWTWRLDNGTVGLGRPPARTREEAVETMRRFNARA